VAEKEKEKREKIKEKSGSDRGRIEAAGGIQLGKQTG
jgi:hypothetical protein